MSVMHQSPPPDAEEAGDQSDAQGLRALRKRIAPPGSWRERIARFIYGPLIDSLPREWRMRLVPPKTFTPEIVSFECHRTEDVQARPIETIIVFKLDHVGDMIVGLRALEVLRKGFPAARITLVCGSWNEELARRLGWFENVVLFDFFTPFNRDWLNASIEIQSRYQGVLSLGLTTYDLAVDLRHDADTRPCLYRVDARYRAGFAAAPEIGLPYLDLMLPNSEGTAAGEGPPLSLHSAFRLELLASAVVSAFNAAEPHPVKRLVPPDLLPDTRRFAVLAIGAGDPIRVWPIERYAELGRALVGRHDLEIVVLGGPAEGEDAARLVAMLPEGAARSVIAMPIVDLPKLLAAAALCVCNGSGMSHLAAALGIPTVAILGGMTRMEVWRPAGPKAIAIGGRTPCQPCGLRQASECQWDVACLTAVTVTHALAACEKLLALDPAPAISHPR